MSDRICDADGCERSAACRGLCNMHYKRCRKSGELGRVNQPQRGRACSVEGCEQAAARKGMCGMHSARWYRSGNVEVTRRFGRSACTVEDCSDPVIGNGLCSKHYYRLKRHGDVRYQIKAEPGSGHVGDNGYRVITVPGHPVARASGTALAHRVALYDSIGPGSHPCHWCGRTVTWFVDLTTDHLDWNRQNNAPENLVASCQPCNSSRVQEHRLGERAPNARLTEADVRAIRAASGTHTSIAARFGVARTTVTHIRLGHTWGHIT